MYYKKIKEIASSKKIEINEIAKQLEMTSNGFRTSIKNETISLRTLKKLCNLLNLNPLFFFNFNDSIDNITDLDYHQNILMQNRLENKNREISYLKQRIEDQAEIIRLLREKELNSTCKCN